MAMGVNHDKRRQMVVAKALSLFAKMGYAKVSFLTISEATGIARTALYRYFKTKREIFDEAIHSVTSRLADFLFCAEKHTKRKRFHQRKKRLCRIVGIYSIPQLTTLHAL